MGQCPVCGLELHSTAQAGRSLGVTGSRVRALIDPAQPRLAAVRVGWGWILPAPAVAQFEPQPTGVHLTTTDSPVCSTYTPTCPRCGERLLNVAQTARVLGITKSRVYAILTRGADRLCAFRVGRRWYIPAIAAIAYRDRRAVEQPGEPQRAQGAPCTPPHPGPGQATPTGRKPHMVSEHLRRLPSGWRASPQALARARECGYAVPPGYSFVQRHARGGRGQNGAAPATATSKPAQPLPEASSTD